MENLTRLQADNDHHQRQEAERAAAQRRGTANILKELQEANDKTSRELDLIRQELDLTRSDLDLARRELNLAQRELILTRREMNDLQKRNQRMDAQLSLLLDEQQTALPRHSGSDDVA